ncbi:MAG: hypothetical protein HY299_09980 [Verrucomicrobia bacterium]|nr:hypothetical protein [Verrucomicrobiota bacterium]
MDGQEESALVVVAITAAWFLVAAWRRRRVQGFKRATGCGCGEASGSRGASVLISGRKGEKPRILVR